MKSTQIKRIKKNFDSLTFSLYLQLNTIVEKMLKNKLCMNEPKRQMVRISSVMLHFHKVHMGKITDKFSLVSGRKTHVLD